MKIEKISDIYEVLKGYTRKKRLVVAFANDSHSIEAVYMAVKAGLVEGILVGDTETIQGVCKENGYDESCFKIVHEPNDVRGAETAVEMIRNGEADVIMKGLVSTDKYMRAILNKERGLVAPNAILSHVTVMECSSYHKLLGERGQIPGCIIEGPMALDVAIDKEAAEIKKMQSVVAGDADCLIFPNLESGNVFYKTNTKLGHSKQGAVLVGAKVPSVLSSRGDSVETKLNSIALAAILSE